MPGRSPGANPELEIVGHWHAQPRGAVDETVTRAEPDQARLGICVQAHRPEHRMLAHAAMGHDRESGSPVPPESLPPLRQQSSGTAPSGCTSTPSASSAPLDLFNGE